MSRLERLFREWRGSGHKVLIPYITAGDPDLQATSELIVGMAAAGADVLELGVPFSDPMADGPVIQRAMQRALERGIDLDGILDAVAVARRSTDVPIILFSYYNPLLQYGLEKLVKRSLELNIDGLLVTDVVAEEATQLLAVTEGLDLIFLLAPTSSDERIRKIASTARGFIYVVSRTGVTGVSQTLSHAVKPLIERIRRITDLPIAVGFGISEPEHVAEVWQIADAVVVGSRIVSEIETCSNRQMLVEKIGRLIQCLRGEYFGYQSLA